MGFNSKDLAGYRGKEIDVFVCENVDADPGTDGDAQVFIKVRGAQNFNTSEERPAPDEISEMGYEVTKAIYGPVTYGLSTELLVRDLVHIARLSGINPSTAKKLNVADFVKTNAVAYFRDPDTGDVNLTKIVSGFKARTASTPMAVGANTSVTLEGAADLASTFDGKAAIVQYVQKAVPEASTNERNKFFDVPVDSVDDIYQVEKGEGVIEPEYDAVAVTAGWALDDATSPTLGDSVVFKNALGAIIAPPESAVIRIVHLTT